jgi:hypothetical protein
MVAGALKGRGGVLSERLSARGLPCGLRASLKQRTLEENAATGCAGSLALLHASCAAYLSWHLYIRTCVVCLYFYALSFSLSQLSPLTAICPAGFRGRPFSLWLALNSKSLAAAASAARAPGLVLILV